MWPMNIKDKAMKSVHERLKQVARFGAMRLMRDRSGLATIDGPVGGAPTEVKEWISMFGHELVLKAPRRRPDSFLPWVC